MEEKETAGNTESSSPLPEAAEVKADVEPVAEIQPGESSKGPVEDKPVENKAAGQSSKKKKGPKKGDLTLIDLGFGALLLVLLAFLMVNVYVIHTASNYNSTICQSSMDFVKVAAMEGRDTDSIVRAAYGCMDRCAKGGFFVERPNLVLVNDEITKDLRTVTVSTTCRALIPVPFLVMDKSRFENDGMHMIFKNTCCFKLNNPKNCQGTHKIRIPGKTLEVKKDAPPENKTESK